jgi:hypothetical protein
VKKLWEACAWTVSLGTCGTIAGAVIGNEAIEMLGLFAATMGLAPLVLAVLWRFGWWLYAMVVDEAQAAHRITKFPETVEVAARPRAKNSKPTGKTINGEFI